MRVGEHERPGDEHDAEDHGQPDRINRSLRESRLLRWRAASVHLAGASVAVVMSVASVTSRPLSLSRTAVGGRFEHLVDDLPVGEEDHPVGVGGGVGVVGDHDDGLAELAHRVAQETEHLGAGAGVEVAGRLVGEDDLGPGDQGPGAGDPLLLAAGQLAGPVPEPVAQADGVDDRVEPVLVGLAPGDGQRQQDVLLRGQRGQQVELLEDEADLVPAQGRQGLVRQPGQRRSRRCAPRRGSPCPARPGSASALTCPSPDGPMIAVNRPRSRPTLTPRSAMTCASPTAVHLPDVRRASGDVRFHRGCGGHGRIPFQRYEE